MCMGLRLWVGVNVAVKLVVRVWVGCRRWLMVRMLIRRLWVVGVVVRHDRRRRREGTVMSTAIVAAAADAATTAATARCARVMPMVERGCRSGPWVRARVRGRRGTLRGKDATES